jgi:two-component system chemotaxis response regulator CheY
MTNTEKSFRSVMKVLIVDDSNPISNAVAGMLEQIGYQHQRAQDGKEALEKIEKESYDLILLDWNMPNMTGIEFLEYNHNNHVTNAKIVMMTTEDDPEKMMKAIEFGACEYIMKPFTLDILMSKLEMIKKAS